MQKEEKHIFVGTHMICLQCGETIKAKCHLPEMDSIPINEPLKPEPIIPEATLQQVQEIEQAVKQTEFPQQTPISSEKSKDESPKYLVCPGHDCITCGKFWAHSYKCGKPEGKYGQCKDCAQQATAEIFRPKHLPTIEKIGNGVLPNDKIVHTFLQAEVEINKIIRNEDGSLKDDFIEIISKHVLNLEEQIAALRTKGAAYNKVCTDAQNEVMNKLSDEDREQFARDAKKRKQAKQTDSQKQQTPKQLDDRKAWLKELDIIKQALKAKGRTEQDAHDRAVNKLRKVDDKFNKFVEDGGLN